MRGVLYRLLASLLVLLAVGLVLAAGEVPAARPHIRGRVTDAETGAPLPDAKVVLAIYPPGPASIDDPESISDSERYCPQLDADARFDLEVPERFGRGSRVVMVVGARAHEDYALVPRFWLENSRPARLTGGDLELDTKLRRLATYEGIVTDELGEPVSGVRVSSCVSIPEGSGQFGSFPFEPLNWPDPEASDAKGRWHYHAIPDRGNWTEFGARRVIWLERDGMLPVILPSPDKLPVSDGVISIRTTMHPGQSLSGVVLDTKRAPVEGAKVAAESLGLPRDPYGVFFKSETTSDRSGRFTLSGLGDRPYAVAISHSGFASVTVRPWDRGAKPRTLTIRLEPGCDLTGRLVRADGRPLRRVRILAFDPKPSRLLGSTKTAEDGSFTIESLPRGTVSLHVGSPSLLEREVSLPAPSQTLRLPARREVVVNVRDASTGRWVLPGGSVEMERTSPSWSTRYGEPSDDGAGLSFGLVFPGNYTVRARLDGFVAASKEVRVEGGSGPAQAIELDVRPGFPVTGHVSDGSGAPISGARIYAQGLGRGNSRTATTGPDGSYRLDGLDDTTGIVGTAYVFMARAEGRAPAVNFETFSRVSFFDRRLDFVLSDGGIVRGRVAHQDGSPVSGAVVRVKGRELFWTLPMIYRVGYADADGRYVLEHVPAGDVAVVAGDDERVVSVTEHGDSVADFVVATPTLPAR